MYGTVHGGEPKVTVSPLSGYHNLAVAMADPGDSHPGGPIRLLTGDNTPPAGRRVWRRCAETYPTEQESILVIFLKMLFIL